MEVSSLFIIMICCFINALMMAIAYILNSIYLHNIHKQNNDLYVFEAGKTQI